MMLCIEPIASMSRQRLLQPLLRGAAQSSCRPLSLAVRAPVASTSKLVNTAASKPRSFRSAAVQKSVYDE